MLPFKDAVIIKNSSTSKLAFIPVLHSTIIDIDSDYESYCSGKLKREEFQTKYGISPNDLILFGDTTSVTSASICNYLDCADVKETEEIKFRKSYKCFCGHAHGLDYTKQVLHPVALSSWKCLLTYTDLPRYAVIINAKGYEKFISKD